MTRLSILLPLAGVAEFKATFVVVAAVVLTLAGWAGVSRAGGAADRPVTDEESAAIAKRIEAASAARDAAAINDVFDMETCARRITEGAFRESDFAKRFLRELKAKGFGAIAIGAQGDSAGYAFLRARGTAADPTLLFRFLCDGGLNYHEFHLARDASGAVRAVDVDLFTAGERFSQMMRRQFLQGAAALRRDPAGLAPGEAELLDHAKEIADYARLSAAGKPAEALAIYDAWPQSLRTDKAWMIVRLSNAEKVSQDLYRRALDDFDKQFPNDPAGVMMQLDRCFLDKDWPGYDRAIDAIDKKVGGDPYLDYLRGAGLIARGKRDEARRLLTALVTAHPGIDAAPYDSLIEIALAAKDDAEVIQLIDLAERRTSARYDADAIAKSPDFAAFAESPQGRLWLSARRAVAPVPAARPPTK